MNERDLLEQHTAYFSKITAEVMQ